MNCPEMCPEERTVREAYQCLRPERLIRRVNLEKKQVYSGMSHMSEAEVTSLGLTAHQLTELTDPEKLYPLYLDALEKYGKIQAWGRAAASLFEDYWSKTGREKDDIYYQIKSGMMIVQTHLDIEVEHGQIDKFVRSEKIFLNGELFTDDGYCPVPPLAKGWYATAQQVIRRAESEGKFK